MSMRPVLAAVLCAGLAAPAAAQDRQAAPPAEALLTAADPAPILAIARGWGWAELATDSAGDPMIRGRRAGQAYWVYFYDCTASRDCLNIQFRTIFPLPAGVSANAINRWNGETRFGKAYIDDEGDLVVKLDVNLWGGVSAANLDDTFDWWFTVTAAAQRDLARR
jgi:hypothetical protein